MGSASGVILDEYQLGGIPSKPFDFTPVSPLACCTREPFLVGCSLAVWASASLVIYAIVRGFLWDEGINESGEEWSHLQVPYLIPLIICYMGYIGLFACPAGFFPPLAWWCCGSTSRFIQDRVVESLRKDWNGSTHSAVSHIDQLYNQSPFIELHCEAYHWESNTSTPGSTTSGSGSTRLSNSSSRVVSWEGTQTIPILRWKDLSPSSLFFEEAINSSKSNMFVINYNHLYELHPGQYALLEDLRRHFENSNAWRDSYTSCEVRYHISNVTPRPVDIVTKEKTNSFMFARIFLFNSFAFTLFLYSTLLLPYNVLYRTFFRQVTYNSTKYLHIGLPR